jgi:transcriptional regulator with XRE-family HTH domain
MAQFIRDLYQRSGCSTWDQFAARAGVHAVQISDWQRGEHIPDGYNLLKLIHASGILDAPGVPVVASIEELVTAIEDRPEFARALAPSLRQVTQEIRALAIASLDAADRLDALLDEHNA